MVTITGEARRLVHRAWWRYVALGAVGGWIVTLAIEFGIRAVLDAFLGSVPRKANSWREAAAVIPAWIAYFAVLRYSFREAVRALFYDLKAAKLVGPETLV